MKIKGKINTHNRDLDFKFELVKLDKVYGSHNDMVDNRFRYKSKLWINDDLIFNNNPCDPFGLTFYYDKEELNFQFRKSLENMYKDVEVDNMEIIYSDDEKKNIMDTFLDLLNCQGEGNEEFLNWIKEHVTNFDDIQYQIDEYIWIDTKFGLIEMMKSSFELLNGYVDLGQYNSYYDSLSNLIWCDFEEGV